MTKRLEKNQVSNSDKYNDCNPRDDSYCIFEKEAKERLEMLNEFKKGYEDCVDCITLADKYQELYDKFFGDET